MGAELRIGISNKHIHLSQADLDVLFGKGYELVVLKNLVQLDEFAAEEKVDAVGPKGTLKGIRILGPVRPRTQLELAFTDARTIGIKAPVRESGNIEGSPGCKLVGPAGELEIKEGVIIASRHVHLSEEDAKNHGLSNGERIKIKCGEGSRSTIFEDVLVRVKDTFVEEVHLDTDEANAAGLGPDSTCVVV